MKGILSDYRSFFKSMNQNVARYLGIMFFATIVTAAYNVLFGIYMKNAGFTEETVGQILSLKTFGVALGAIPVAVFSERFNKRNTLIAGLGIMMVSSFIILNIPYEKSMSFFALIFGVGHATVMILQAPIIFENTSEEHRVTAFSMAFVMQNIAFVFGSFVLGHLSQHFSGLTNELKGNLMVLNGATFLIAIAIIIALKLSGSDMRRSNKQKSAIHDMVRVFASYRKLLKGKTLMYLTQVALVGLGAGMIVPFFSMYLKYTLEVNDGVVGTIMAISQVGTVIGGLAVPPLAKRLGRIQTVIACQLLSIPFLISISFPQGIVIITISFFFRSSLMNMASPIIGSLAMEIVDDEVRTHMSGMTSLINNLFRAIGIFIGGFLMFRFSYNTPYYWTILCYLIGTIIIYNVFNEKKGQSDKSRFSH